jgi:hypothetical protein
MLRSHGVHAISFCPLIRRVPLAVISHRRQREPLDRVALAIPKDAVDFSIIVGMHPRAVVVRRLHCGHDMAATDLR